MPGRHRRTAPRALRVARPGRRSRGACAFDSGTGRFVRVDLGAAEVGTSTDFPSITGAVPSGRPAIDLGAAWAGDDLASALGNVTGFLREQQRGLPRFHRDRAGQEPVSRLTVLTAAAAICFSVEHGPVAWFCRCTTCARSSVLARGSAVRMTPTRCGLTRPGWRTSTGDRRTELWLDIACVAQASTTPGSIVGESPRHDVEPAIGFIDPDGRPRRSGIGIDGRLRVASPRPIPDSTAAPTRPAALRFRQSRGVGLHYMWRSVRRIRTSLPGADYITPPRIDRTTIYDVARRATSVWRSRRHHGCRPLARSPPVAEISILRRCACGRLRVGTVIHGPRSDLRQGRAAAIEAAIGAEWHGHPRMLGAAYSCQTAVAPTGYVSVVTVDSAKHLLGSAVLRSRRWQIGPSREIACSPGSGSRVL